MHDAIREAYRKLQELEQQCASFTPTDPEVALRCAEYQQRWVELQPVEKTQPPPAQPSQPNTLQTDDVARMIGRQIDAAVGVLCDVLGAEVGQSESALKKELRSEIGQLRAEVTLLQSQLRKQIDGLQQAAIDLPMLPLRGNQHGQH
jgi:hypothetical protein